jgi:hypothetical protein
MLGSVKIGAAICVSVSGFPARRHVAVTKQSVSSVGNGFVVPLIQPVRLPHKASTFDGFQRANLCNFFFWAAVP